MRFACRCQALLAMLMAGLFVLSHTQTARARVLATERPLRARATAVLA